MMKIAFVAVSGPVTSGIDVISIVIFWSNGSAWVDVQVFIPLRVIYSPFGS